MVLEFVTHLSLIWCLTFYSWSLEIAEVQSTVSPLSHLYVQTGGFPSTHAHVFLWRIVCTYTVQQSQPSWDAQATPPLESGLTLNLLWLTECDAFEAVPVLLSWKDQAASVSALEAKPRSLTAWEGERLWRKTEKRSQPQTLPVFPGLNPWPSRTMPTTRTCPTCKIMGK